MFTAFGILFPQIFHTFGENAAMLFSPMHIPVLLCGFVCGRRYGAISGMLTPLLSMWILRMPPLFLVFPMAIELAAYGYIAGLAVKFLHPVFSLIATMVAGRIVFSLACWALFPLFTLPPWASHSFEWIATAAFVTGWPGMLTHIFFIPLILFALQKAKAISIPTLSKPVFSWTKASFKTEKAEALNESTSADTGSNAD